MDMQKKIAEIKAMPLSRSKQAVEMVMRLGISQSDAAREVGITPTAVCLEAAKKGLSGRTPAGTDACISACRKSAADYRARHGYPNPVLLVELHEKNGSTYADIAKRYGLTRSQVAGFIRRARKDANTYA